MAGGGFSIVGAIMRRCNVSLVGDLYERACDRGIGLPLDGKRRRRLRKVDRARTLFIHIPKNAGMSIAQALYGEQIKHATIRYYAKAAPRLLWRTPSFAVLRDPVARFVSAFNYAQAGGSDHNRVSAPFIDRYKAFRTIEDALDHLEDAADIYRIDHIFRPQSWYITDRKGSLIVDRLFLLERFDQVCRFLALRGIEDVPHLNHVEKPPTALEESQVARIRNFYARDFALIEALRDDANQRLPLPRPWVRWGDPHGSLLESKRA
jgi:hypothetical protein